LKTTGVRLAVAAGIFALTSGVGVATALPAQAQTAVADWNFDETGSPPPVLADDSGTVPANNDYDLLRKGVAASKGGEYKVEIVNNSGVAHAMCLIKDAAGHVGRITSRGLSVADGTSHTITCTKISTSVTVAVDNLTPRTAVASGGLGSVSNTADLLIGAKNKAYEDGFVGSMSAATLY